MECMRMNALDCVCSFIEVMPIVSVCAKENKKLGAKGER